MTATALAPPAATPTAQPAAPRIVRFLPLRPGWPLTGLLLLYPLWWVLGLGVLIFPIMAVPMAVLLVRRGRVAVPPLFGLWVAYLLVVVASMVALGIDPADTVPSSFAGRLPAAGFRVAEYVSLTVVLLYAGNADVPRERLVRLLGWMFVLTVAGGLLGTFAGHFAFTSPVEALLPHKLRSMGFIASMVHPAAAQVQDVLGHPSPRPAAPWGYTNTWGNNYCLLVGWFAAAWWRRSKALTLACLAASAVPVVYSLNRGLWVGVGVAALYVALRLAVRGRLWALAGLAVAATVAAIALAVTPLGDVVTERLEHGHSNGVRVYVTEQVLDEIGESPVLGFGSTRTTAGGRNSIAVGSREDCERCGNFTVGGNGQLWQSLYAHGVLGAGLYVGFFLAVLWRFRRDATPVGVAGSVALLGCLVAMFWYNALVTPLAFALLSYALLWKNERSKNERPGVVT